MSLIQRGSRYLDLALALPSCVVAGLLFGYWADRHFHRHYFYIIGLCLGSVAGLMQTYKMIGEFLKETGNKKDK